MKTLQIKQRSPILLKGASLEEQNLYILNILKENGINNFDIRFEPEKLQSYIDDKKTFNGGLVAYLKSFENKLSCINNLSL